MNILSGVIDDFLKFIKHCECEEELNVEVWLSHPLNDKRATEDEIANTEQRLGCSLPSELKKILFKRSKWHRSIR